MLTRESAGTRLDIVATRERAAGQVRDEKTARWRGRVAPSCQNLNRVLERPAGPFLGPTARPTGPHAVIFSARVRVWSAESGPVGRREIPHLRRPRVAEQGADPDEILFHRGRHHRPRGQRADHIARAGVPSHRPDTGSHLLNHG